MTHPVEFELHRAQHGSPETLDIDSMSVNSADEEEEQYAVLSLLLNADDEAPAWVGVDATGTLRVVDDEAEGIAGFAVVQRRLGTSLGIIPRSPELSVNGIPALPFHVLMPRDLLVLAPGIMTYVTERFSPYVGPALKEHIGMRCPCCKIKITDQTHVVTCRCGCVYHHETQESHPELKEDDRLDCFEKVRACLSCSRPLTLDSVLVWDPAEIE